jgi:fatty acid desaturase
MAARRVAERLRVPSFSNEQIQRISEISRDYSRWYRSHPRLHNTLNVLVLLLLIALDLPVLIEGALWLGERPARDALWWLAASGLSLMHGLLMYSLSNFSMHEGAAHNRIIASIGPVSRSLQFLANNACRLAYADPEFYCKHHAAHHGHFGTPSDGSFVSFVNPRRFLISLLPLAGILDFNDFRVHCDTKPSRSRRISFLVGTAYLLPIGCFMAVADRPLLPLVVLVLLGPWCLSTLDRLRESSEHNMMSLEARHGTRNLGLGFWGLLIGGGPWGQPCHLSHHLAPALPWYFQCLLHVRLKQMMTPDQRRHFTLTPVLGYPRLVMQIAHSAVCEAGRRSELETRPVPDSDEERKAA